ncbi:hypothetical protein B4N89_33050 [Embleya scabrispora]|uniref:Uncharacterized protein n=1 Tax=Embleya scabrispora TaxID=159449 RepID=A0A1T3NQD4_9ACTN|nr:hypothetical protein [Embleya scabrispora]OPC78945.1 hypothetical protein B4N89_33050 [Embleya scabrispora]
MGRQRTPRTAAEPRRLRTAADMAKELPTPFRPLSDSPVLIDDEQRQLAACEAAIETLRVAFWAAGKALQIVRDARLYRTRYESFEEYCLDRWDMQRRYADRLIQAWPIAEALSPIGLKAVNEAQVRELVPLAGRYGNEAAVTVYRTVAEAEFVPLTASVLRGAVAAIGDAFSPAAAVEQVRRYLDSLGIEPAEPEGERVVDYTAKAADTIPRRWLSTLARQDRAAAVAYLDELERQVAQARRELAEADGGGGDGSPGGQRADEDALSA